MGVRPLTDHSVVAERVQKNFTQMSTPCRFCCSSKLMTNPKHIPQTIDRDVKTNYKLKHVYNHDIFSFYFYLVVFYLQHLPMPFLTVNFLYFLF